ncbi:MAG TPA: PH domain-containing protein [Natronosporangium sp.]
MARRRGPVSSFRYHRAWPLAGLMVSISLVTLGAYSAWLALLALPPLVWTWWAWHAGTDADQDGLRVRALLGRRRIEWSRVDTLVPDQRGRIVATTTDGRALLLTAVTRADLPRLTAVTGSPQAG